MASIAPRDFQRSRLYKFERIHIFNREDNITIDSEEEMQWVVDESMKRLWPDLVAPTVRHNSRLTNRSYSATRRIEISTNISAHHTIAVVLHELAHNVIDELGLSGRVAGHGPEFVHIYGKFLEMWGVIGFSEFLRLATRSGVSVFERFDADDYGTNFAVVRFNANSRRHAFDMLYRIESARQLWLTLRNNADLDVWGSQSGGRLQLLDLDGNVLQVDPITQSIEGIHA